MLTNRNTVGKLYKNIIQHELADDLDNEKKIYHAEAHAAKSSKKSAFQRNALQSISTVAQAQPASTATVQPLPIPLLCLEERLLARFPEVLVHRGLLLVLVLHVERSVTGERVVLLNQQVNNGAGQKKQ